MSIESSIIKRLFEYRTIRVSDEVYIWRTSDGKSHMRKEGVTTDISIEKYNSLRSGSVINSEPEYSYPSSKIAYLPKGVKEDIIDFQYHLKDVQRNSTGRTAEELGKILQFLVDTMIDTGSTYQEVKWLLSKRQQRLVNSRLENSNANNISKDILVNNGR